MDFWQSYGQPFVFLLSRLKHSMRISSRKKGPWNRVRSGILVKVACKLKNTIDFGSARVGGDGKGGGGEWKSPGIIGTDSLNDNPGNVIAGNPVEQQLTLSNCPFECALCRKSTNSPFLTGSFARVIRHGLFAIASRPISNILISPNTGQRARVVANWRSENRVSFRNSYSRPELLFKRFSRLDRPRNKMAKHVPGAHAAEMKVVQSRLYGFCKPIRCWKVL